MMLKRGSNEVKKSEMFYRSLSTSVNLEVTVRQFSLITLLFQKIKKKKMKQGNIIVKIYRDLLGLSVPEIK